MSNKKATFQDIADYTGFSKTTISRYFNHPEYLTEKNRLKIEAALKVLDYKENKVAKILAKGQTEYIGLIIPHMFMSYYSFIMDRFLRTYDHYDYKFIVFSGGADAAAERRYIKELLRYQVEGIIVLSHMIPSEELASYDVPVVTVEREDCFVDSVNTDNYAGGIMATELLLRNHCDQMIYVSTDSRKDIPAFDRYRGFQEICEKNGVLYEGIFRDSVFAYEFMRDFAVEVLESIEERHKGKRKGIFCSNDVLATIILNHIFRKYGCLPDDYRIVGFDDSPIAEQAILALSSVGQQVDLMVSEAMDLLEDQIRRKKEGKAGTPDVRHRLVPPQLIVRETAT